MRGTRMTPLRLLACALLVAALGVVAPVASADCGQSVIDSYFATGTIGYHSQDCYAAALTEVDADAKMYSGIMGAIRAARARDAAADAAKARKAHRRQTAVSGADGGSTDGADQGSAGATTAENPPTTGVDEPAATTAQVVMDAAQPRDAALPAEQASRVAAARDPGPPLAVIVIAGLGALLLVVGVGGLAVRRLGDRG